MDKDLSDKLSPWWANSILIVLILGFSVLIWMSTNAYKDAPPIPEKVINETGQVLFTGEDILKGQEVFLKYGLMENGTIWGHGAYLGPDFSSEYLHALKVDILEIISQTRFGKNYKLLNNSEKGSAIFETKELLKENRFNKEASSLVFTKEEEISYYNQIKKWTEYLSNPNGNFGLSRNLIKDQNEIKLLTSFFAWTAWASVTNRPGKSYSYTNNFPYDLDIGNVPSSDSLIWSALSILVLLCGIGVVLFSFGKFNYLGWKNQENLLQPKSLPGLYTESQKGVIKYFVIVSLLFLAQSLLGGATAHYRAEPGNFFGFDLSFLLPSNIVRTWHLQLAIFWIATSYIAGGLMLAPMLGCKEPGGQALGVNILFFALIVVVVGSMAGEYLGVKNLLGENWFLLGHQGWEYLDLGRIWQVLLAVGLLIWLFLLYRGIKNAFSSEDKDISSLFLYSAIAIPLFYLPAFFFNGKTHFSVVDTWRFWIIHLWVEGFFELFVTTMVAVIFYKLGVSSKKTAIRVVYLDAILYLSSGIIGTGHHWYWSGLSNITMALGAIFSALEVVPLTLLTLDAWDFIKLSKVGGLESRNVFVIHKWTFYFLMAVGFWNFLGAGVFGFLINLPIVSYFEVGTLLTPNHGHAAMMGVFGMLAIALMVFSYRHVSVDESWKEIEKYIKISFYGLNLGLILMVVSNLFPAGILQLIDVLNNGYWHARSTDFLNQSLIRKIEWARLPADIIFIVVGCIPLVIASIKTYFGLNKKMPEPVEELCLED